MIDLLDKINKQEITINEAYDIFDDVIEKFHNGEIKMDPYDYLCIDRYERTANGHALSLSTLSIWRKTGWPNKCGICGKDIDYKNFYWTIKNDTLVHIDCTMQDK